MITRVEVKDYKCLADVAVDLTPLHAVVGPSDSGKTCFLEAVAALVNARRYGNNALPQHWDGRELVWWGAKAAQVDLTAVVKWGGLPEPHRFTQVIRFPEDGTKIGGGPVFHASEPPFDDPRRELARALLFRLDLRTLSQSSLPKKEYVLNPLSFGVAATIDHIYGNSREHFDSLEAEFCKLFPMYTRISIRYNTDHGNDRPASQERPGTEQYLAKDLFLVTRHDGREVQVRAAQASGGALLMLAYLSLRFLPDPPGVILIEEPENGVHPQRLGDVVRVMREIASDAADGTGPQIILASHSPYLLDYLEPEEVTVFARGENGAVRTLRLSDSERVRWELKHFHLGEIWASEGEEKLFGLAAKEAAR